MFSKKPKVQVAAMSKSFFRKFASMNDVNWQIVSIKDKFIATKKLKSTTGCSTPVFLAKVFANYERCKPV